MNRVFLIALLFTAPAFATKGLLTDNVLEPVNGGTTEAVPNPKVASSLVDLNMSMTDRTNQAMVLQSLNATQAVFDESDPYANTLQVNYQPTKTIKIRAREFMQTIIILPKGDAIKMYNLGDTQNFEFKESVNPYEEELPNSGTVSVTLPGADTSLHIIGTSGNVYTFYIRGDTWDSPHNPTMKVIVTDDKLLAKLEAKKRREAIEAERLAKQKALESNDAPLENPDYLEKVEFDPAKLDFGYRIIGGDESLRPYMVYDDGHFTYIRYSKGGSVSEVRSFPAVYRVADGSDLPVNVSPNGSTLRAEGLSNRWTLRLGNSWICIEKIEPISAQNSAMNVVLDDEV